MTAAIEIYNKPCFPYREEVFSILALNAWELLLKAAVLKSNNNDLRSIRVYEPKKLKSGRPSKKLYLKKNRTGNYQTINLGTCFNKLTGKNKIAGEVKTNLLALIAIRDNSVHYVTPSSVLATQIQEIASGCVFNFLRLANEWFSRDLSSSLSLVLPLSFAANGSNEAVIVSPDENRVIRHLSSIVSADIKEPTDFAVALRLSLKMERSSSASAAKVQISKDQDALKVTLSEEDIRDRYPWDYDQLRKCLRKRYSNFITNKKFYDLKKPLETNEAFCKPRLLDPSKPKGTKKLFYNPNIMTEFDKHYAAKA